LKPSATRAPPNEAQRRAAAAALEEELAAERRRRSEVETAFRDVAHELESQRSQAEVMRKTMAERPSPSSCRPAARSTRSGSWSAELKTARARIESSEAETRAARSDAERSALEARQAMESANAPGATWRSRRAAWRGNRRKPPRSRQPPRKTASATRRRPGLSIERQERIAGQELERQRILGRTLAAAADAERPQRERRAALESDLAPRAGPEIVVKKPEPEIVARSRNPRCRQKPEPEGRRDQEGRAAASLSRKGFLSRLGNIFRS